MAQWHIEDHDGTTHTMLTKNCYYIVTIPTHILSPQHVTQATDDLSLMALALMLSKATTLFWKQCQFTKTIPLDPKLNIGLTFTAPSDMHFQACLAQLDVPCDPCVFETQVIQLDDDDASF